MSELKPCPMGQWNYPSELPTHKENEIVDCVVTVKGVKTGIVRVEETEYRYGEWDISKDQKQPDFYKPTNADRLRSMNDEGLAEWLDGLRSVGTCNRYRNGKYPIIETLAWLQQPAEE